AISVWKKLGLVMVHVNKALGRFALPVRPPFFEILARQLLEDQAAENVISRRLIERIRRAYVVLSVAMFQSHVQLHRLAVALNAERNNITGIGVRCEQIRELDLAVKRIHVVAVLINVVNSDRGYDVANLEPRL